MGQYLRSPVSNGNPDEQALIRRWWHEMEDGRGRIVWEYYVRGRYVDAIWFPDAPEDGKESNGQEAPTRFPLMNERVVICEAKLALTPELIGQALVYTQFVLKEKAEVLRTIVFSKHGSDPMIEAAADLDLYLALGEESIRWIEPRKKVV